MSNEEHEIMLEWARRCGRAEGEVSGLRLEVAYLRDCIAALEDALRDSQRRLSQAREPWEPGDR